MNTLRRQKVTVGRNELAANRWAQCPLKSHAFDQCSPEIQSMSIHFQMNSNKFLVTSNGKFPLPEKFGYRSFSMICSSFTGKIVLKNRLDRGSMSLIVRRIHASALDEFWFELSRVRWAFIWKYDFELQNGESISNNSWTCHSKLASVSSMPPGKFNFPKNPYGLQASILEDFFGFNYKR